ncbi:MAG: CCA tRNA nucleotidyltransferase [Thermoleophilia bacterium]|nr:CCA tRNA nucleotidyltransferase [Thermoleophilia bacterium]
MDAERIRIAVSGGEAYIVGGAVRDELLGRPVLDVDVACREPERAARAYRGAAGGAVFLLSERHGAWRVALRDGRTVDFTELRGTLAEDLAGRDFTINAIAVPVAGGEPIDPLGGRADASARILRAVSGHVFADDPLRLLRAVRLEDELGFRLEAETEALVRRDARLCTRPAGERVLAELARLSAAGYRRLAELGLLEQLGGSPGPLETLPPGAPADLLLVTALGRAIERLPVSNEQRRFARTLLRARRPADDSPRELHRFRRATEPWALEALAFLGVTGLRDAVEAARAADPPAPLVRGDELGLPPGPEIGRLLALIEEERAAGTIATREQAFELLARETGR